MQVLSISRFYGWRSFWFSLLENGYLENPTINRSPTADILRLAEPFSSMSFELALNVLNVQYDVRTVK